MIASKCPKPDVNNISQIKINLLSIKSFDIFLRFLYTGMFPNFLEIFQK